MATASTLPMRFLINITFVTPCLPFVWLRLHLAACCGSLKGMALHPEGCSATHVSQGSLLALI